MVDTPIKIDLNIDVNSERAEKALKELKFELPKSADDIASKVAEIGARGLRRELYQQGSVNTGTLVRNTRAEKLRRGEAQIVLPLYGLAVDQGSEPHWPPTENNPRLEAAARSYGMNRYQLAASIADKGTREHPFIEPGLRRMEKSLRNEAGKQVDQALRKAF